MDSSSDNYVCFILGLEILMIPKDKQKLTYLQWQDAHANGAWFTAEQLEEKIRQEAFICEEVGWIVYEDDKEIHLCSRRGVWDKKSHESSIFEYGAYQRIPKTWILKRKVIKI